MTTDTKLAISDAITADAAILAAMQFYANRDNWTPRLACACSRDRGHVARLALERCGEIARATENTKGQTK